MYYTASQKLFVHNFYKCWPIFKILSLLYSQKIATKLGEFFIFQQGDASAHRALQAISLLERETRVVVSVSTSRSRDVPTSRLGLVSRKIVNVSVSSRSRPFTSHPHADGAVRSVNGL